MLPDAETTLTVVSKNKYWTVQYHTDTGSRACEVYGVGVRIRCSKIHKSDLAREIKLKRSSRAEREWTLKDWQAAMDEIKNRGCWGIKHRNHKGTRNQKRVYNVWLGEDMVF